MFLLHYFNTLTFFLLESLFLPAKCTEETVDRTEKVFFFAVENVKTKKFFFIKRSYSLKYSSKLSFASF
jgi:hypothetical protein